MMTSRWMGVFAVTISMLMVGACGPTWISEPSDSELLYNTVQLASASLFDPDGLALPAYSEESFVRVGLMWDAPEETLMEARTLGQDSNWSRWTHLVPVWSEQRLHAGHLDVARGEAVGFQLRMLDGSEPSYLMAESIRVPVETFRAAEPRERRLETVTHMLAPSSLVHPRSDWGAKSPICYSGYHSPSEIAIHHSDTPTPDSYSPEARIRQIQNYHMYSHGWCDIGYHFLVDWNGEVWQGRDETRSGAHVGGHNTNNVGISFLGSFNGKQPSSAQMSAGAGILDWVTQTHSISKDRSHIKGHREYRGNRPGDCPGDMLYARLQELIEGYQGKQDGVLKGVVFADQGSGLAVTTVRLPRVEVNLVDLDLSVVADSNGFWTFDVPEGMYTVTASAGGYLTSSRTCEVLAGSESWCSVGLLPEAQPGILKGVVFEDQGDWDTSLRLPQARVELSGVGGLALTDSSFWSVEVPEGRHTVSAWANGYLIRSRTCEVTSGATTWCSVGLEPEAPPGVLKGVVYIDQGTWDTSQRLPGAQVTVSGWGAAEVSGSSFWTVALAEGAYTVTASADGYLTNSRDCWVSSDAIAWCSVGLVAR